MLTTVNNVNSQIYRERTGCKHEKAGTRLLAALRFRTLKTNNGPIRAEEDFFH